MITLLDKNNKLNENKNTLSISYLRTVSIIFGHYPYPDKVHNFILEIKNNLKKEMENYTNVKGGMTDWNYFTDKKSFNNFLSYIINKNQISHPEIFEYFLEKHFVSNAWGNEIKTGDRLEYHAHNTIHGILYLSKGCDLLLPELNIKITPQPGDYYIFPPNILHGFEKYSDEDNRYSLIFNIEQGEKFEFNKKIKNINDRKNS